MFTDAEQISRPFILAVATILVVFSILLLTTSNCCGAGQSDCAGCPGGVGTIMFATPQNEKNTAIPAHYGIFKAVVGR
jgi:hypothetical protein